MATYKEHSIILDTKYSPRIALQGIVAGETGNRITITLRNGNLVTLASATHRVCLRVDSALGTRRQDSAETDGGITFSNGAAVILLSKDSFTAGLNRCRLEVYSTESETNDTLICSAEFQFDAAGNPTGENAGTVYPSLIKLENELAQLVDEATDAIDDCEDATDAANTAATAANNAASSANTAATSANNAAAAAEEASHAADDAAQTADLAAAAANSAAGSANAAASAANTAAAAAAAIQRSFYTVPHTTPVWSGNNFTCTASVDLTDIASTARLAFALELPTTEEILYEYVRSDSAVHLASRPDGDGVYTIATINLQNNTITGGGAQWRLDDDMIPSGIIEEYMLESTVRKKFQFYVVPHEAITWKENGLAQFYSTISSETLEGIMAYARLALVIEDPDGNPFTLYEVQRVGDYVSFRSLPTSAGLRYYATMTVHFSGGYPRTDSRSYTEKVPVSASVSNGVVTFNDRNGAAAFSFTLPIYNGGVQ